MVMREWQFDGLVGPTHNYAGLAYGNVASKGNKGAISNPKKAALQGLEKARFVRDLGIQQSIIPPHYRPMIPKLQQCGFDGGISDILDQAYRFDPSLLASVYSSAFMWVANTGMVTPSADAADKKLHLTPANLLTNFHRSIEANFTTLLWQRLLPDAQRFHVHDPLPYATRFSDEGAANHMRVSGVQHTSPGLHIYVYGVSGASEQRPKHYPARQTREACEAIARQHGIDADRLFFVQQSPEAIDAGVFHNDVIAMNTTRLMITHEKAFVEGESFLRQLGEAAKGMDWHSMVISEAELPMSDAVKSYLFNSQLLELPDGRIVIVAPSDCEEIPAAKQTLERLAGSNGPISTVHYRDVRESMRNGGGPACLRLRLWLTDEEAAAMHQGVVLTDQLYDQLVQWVQTHYRDRLQLEDLRDPSLIAELNVAYLALEEIVGLPGLYREAIVAL
jgi:succinylarginine dihydrolase